MTLQLEFTDVVILCPVRRKSSQINIVHVTVICIKYRYIVINNLTSKGKGNVDLFSASSRMPLTRSNTDHTVLGLTA